MGEVIPLPLPKPRARSCFLCVHAVLGEQTYCWMYQEFILNERSAAEDCEIFDDDPEKT